MNALMKVLVLSVTVLTFVGCGSDKKNNNNNLYGPYGPYGMNGYPGYQQNLNPNAVILGGGLNLENGKAWKAALQGIGACNDRGLNIHTCHLIDNAAPRLMVTLNDYQFSQNATTTGSVTIGSAQVQGRPYIVTWYKVANQGFDTQVLPQFGFANGQNYSNNRLLIYITGKPTDRYVLAELYYGNQRIGSGQLYRINQ